MMSNNENNVGDFLKKAETFFKKILESLEKQENKSAEAEVELAKTKQKEAEAKKAKEKPREVFNEKKSNLKDRIEKNAAKKNETRDFVSEAEKGSIRKTGKGIEQTQKELEDKIRNPQNGEIDMEEVMLAQQVLAQKEANAEILKEEKALKKEKRKLNEAEGQRFAKSLVEDAKQYQDYATKLKGYTSGLFDAMKAKEDAYLAKLKVEKEEKDKALSAEVAAKKEKLNEDKKLADKEVQDSAKTEQEKKDALQLIQNDYNAAVKEIDDDAAKAKASNQAEYDKEAKRIAREQAKRNKAMKLFDAITGTATAVINGLNTTPFFPMGLIMAATAGAMGVAQVVTIANTPIPEAARGGLIQGLSHAAGGTIIEAERGEAIINKYSTSQFAPLLSAINEAGGGVPFARPFSDGGFTQREYQRQSPGAGVTQAGMAAAMSEAMAKQPVYVAVEDINKADKRYVEVQDISEDL